MMHISLKIAGMLQYMGQEQLFVAQCLKSIAKDTDHYVLIGITRCQRFSVQYLTVK